MISSKNEEEQGLIENEETEDKSYGATSSQDESSKKEEIKWKKAKKDKDKKKKETASLRQLFRYATCGDWTLLFFGTICAFINGAGFPLLSIIFGNMTNSFITAENSLDTLVTTPPSVTPPVVFAQGTNAGLKSLTIDSNFIQPRAPSPQMMENLTAEAFHEQIITFSLQYTYVGIAMMISAYIQIGCWMASCERQVNRIRKEFFKAILHQEISWFDDHQTGELTSQLSDALERIKEGIGDKFGLLMQYGSQLVAGFIVAFIYSWKLTLVMMSLTPLMAAAAAFMSKMVSESTKREQEMYGTAGAVAEEALSCIRTVIAFNGQKQESARYEEALNKARKTGVMKALYTGVGTFFTFFIMFGSYSLAFWYGAKIIVAGEIPPGTVFVVFFSVMTGSFSLGNMAPLIGVLAVAKGAGASILSIIDSKPTIDSYSKEGKKLPKPQGKIEFTKVRFNYPTRKEVTVLDGVSFNVEPGENVALVGPSGCGKSTVVNLLLRYYDVNSGTITVDGENIKNLNVRWLRNLVGVVSQEPVLFDESIAENIRFGKLDVSMDEMIAAAKMANAHTFIMELPDGYNTRVGERGTQLSGGQKQRIAIARALVRDPKVLLLDEATSALDAESEGVVQEALDKAQQGRTTIVIAHRLSTIRNAHKIIALKDGHIAEIGTHVELMNLKGLYYELVTTQLFDSTTSEYASATEENIEEKPESDDSGTSADVSQQKRKSSLKRQLSKRRTSTMSSMTSETSSKAPKRRLTRMLSKVDTEKERLERELKEENVEKSTLLQILKANRPEWPYIVIGMFGAAIRGAVMPAFAFFYSQIFEAYSKKGEELERETTFWSIMFLVIGFAMGSSMLISSYFFGLSGEALTMRLRLNVFKNILRQDVGYFDDPRHSTGKICTRLATDAPNIKAAVDFRLSTILASIVSMIAGITIAFIYGWKLAFLILALVPLIALGGYLATKIRHSSQLSDSKSLEEAGRIASEAIDNVRTVQALTREKTFYENFCDNLKAPYKQSLRQTQIHAVSYAFAQSVIFFMYAASFRMGGYLVEQGDMTPMDVFKVFFAITFCGMTISWATAYFPEFLKARFSAALIFKMLSEEPKIDSANPAGVKPPMNGAVYFKDVHFSYPARPDTIVLNGLDFSVNPSQSLALVGGSGCGKSTVVNLLERFYDPLHGQLGIGEYDLRLMNLKYVRDHIALVSQEPVLFNCSIKDNISYGLENVPYEKIVDSAKKANIHEFILSLPEGYNTRVGEKGTMLSGGQKQRVAIARALVRDPKILLLDEATSALDTESEKIVQEALDKAREGRTCIIIAHRLSTVQGADKIAVIKGGKVVEIGTHQELVAQRGAYYNLTKKQNLQQ